MRSLIGPLTLAGLMAVAPAPGAAQILPAEQGPARPPLPEWSPNVGIHAAAGVLDYSIDPGSPAAAFLLGVSYLLESYVRVELEALGAGASGDLECPDSPLHECTPTGEPRFMLAVMGALRAQTTTHPVRGFVAVQRGVELDGFYGVFGVAVGAEVRAWRGMAVRAQLLQRWDERFFMRENPRGTALLIGLDVAGR